MSDEGKVPLLFDGEASKGGDFGDSPRHRYKQSRRHLCISMGVNAALIVLCTILSIIVVQRTVSTIPESYSPASAAIEYEYRSMNLFDPRYDGFPGPKWDESIHELLNGTLIKISEKEFDQLHVSMPTTPIALEGGGFAGSLGVAHNIHCVKKLKEFLYLDHFFPDLRIPSDKYDKMREHADHCLGFIRQSTLCHVDYSAYTLFWEPGGADMLHSVPEKQKCVNWETLREWMVSRATTNSKMIRD